MALNAPERRFPALSPAGRLIVCCPPLLEAEALEKKRQAGAEHGIGQQEKVQQLIAEAIRRWQAGAERRTSLPLPRRKG